MAGAEREARAGWQASSSLVAGIPIRKMRVRPGHPRAGHQPEAQGQKAAGALETYPTGPRVPRAEMGSYCLPLLEPSAWLPPTEPKQPGSLELPSGSGRGPVLARAGL